MLKVDRHINRVFSSVSYRIGQVLLDPGDEWTGFLGVGAVMLTHAHFDHIYGLNKVIELNPGVRVCTNESGRQSLLDGRKNLSHYHGEPFVIQHPEQIMVVNDGEAVDLGNGLTAQAVFTPGHNPSCITWLIGDSLFTGDSYIPGVKTVTNLPGGNKPQATESEKLILSLAQNRTIFPGHMVFSCEHLSANHKQPF